MDVIRDVWMWCLENYQFVVVLLGISIVLWYLGPGKK